MARGKKTGGRNFQKGVVTNPGGRPKMSDEERTLRQLTRPEVAKMLNKVCGMTTKQMREEFDDENTLAIERLFLKAVLDGFGGDPIRASEFILNRTIGKPGEEIHATVVSTTFERLDGTAERYTIGPKKEGNE